MATGIVGIAYALETLPYNDIVGAALTARLDAEPEAEAIDLWAERSIDIADGTPTVVAVWDTGVDPAVQGERMWTNPDYPSVGTAHGIAFDGAFQPEDSALLIEAQDYTEELDGMLDLMKGSLDTTAGLTNTAEANAFREKLSDLDADQLEVFQKQMTVLGN